MSKPKNTRRLIVEDSEAYEAVDSSGRQHVIKTPDRDASIEAVEESDDLKPAHPVVTEGAKDEGKPTEGLD